MKKYFSLGIILFFSAAGLCAQGFDWQYSPRLPFAVPKLFVGVQGSGSLLYQSGEIQSREFTAECALYTQGSGPGLNAGAYAEYWQTPLIAYFAGVSFQNFSSELSAPGDSLPVAQTKDTVFTAYQYTSSQKYLTFNLGAKYRLFESHFAVGAGIDIGILLGSSSLEKEKVLGPTWYSFTTPNGEHVTERTISDKEIADLRSFFILPQFRLSYDLPLALGMYFSPTVSVGLPVMSMSKEFSWRQTNFSLGISIVKGID